MECWKSAYLLWKTVTLLKSRSMVCCLSTEDNWSHFLQWNENSQTLTGIAYKFHFPFGSWRTRLLVSARWGDGAYSKFNNADVERVLWWKHYFSKLVAPSVPGSIATGFLSWGVLKENVYKKQHAHIRRIKTKYWAVHFKRHCRNSSPGCIKHEEKRECMRRWTRWIFPALNTTLYFVFWFHCNLFFDK
jgi:hypothetical protein